MGKRIGIIYHFLWNNNYLFFLKVVPAQCLFSPSLSLICDGLLHNQFKLPAYHYDNLFNYLELNIVLIWQVFTVWWKETMRMHLLLLCSENYEVTMFLQCFFPPHFHSTHHIYARLLKLMICEPFFKKSVLVAIFKNWIVYINPNV